MKHGANEGFIPYKIRSIEPIRLLKSEEREKRIKEAGLNVFKLKAEDVYIDLLTDSGTGAMSMQQWSRVLVGDESYAGSSSYFRLEKTVQEIMGLPHVIPAHQGRAAENILDHVLIKEGMVVPGNAHFDTTKAHIEFNKGRAVDCTIDAGAAVSEEHPFKGNLDLGKLEQAFKKYGREKIAYVLVTVTCNTVGGQPVSMKNIKDVSEFCKKHGLICLFDAARFAENAYFIKTREDGYANKSVKDIVLEMFSRVDGCTMSSKKDAFVPIGGFVALRDRGLADRVRQFEILFEGFCTYGGMSGMDMEALAQGLTEVVDEDYLAYRIGQVSYLGRLLSSAGVPVIKPYGGHAIFVDGRGFYPNVPAEQFPAQLLTVELYKKGGIRAVEVGLCLAGRGPDTGKELAPKLDLCRMAIPRRVYTNEHLDHVAKCTIDLFNRDRDRKTGLKLDQETKIMRHFTSTFKYV